MGERRDYDDDELTRTISVSPIGLRSRASVAMVTVKHFFDCENEMRVRISTLSACGVSVSQVRWRRGTVLSSSSYRGKAQRVQSV